MNCAYCGTELPPGAMFCGECGRAVSSKPVVQQHVAAAARPEPAALVEPSARPAPEPVREPAPVPVPEPEPEAGVEPDLEPEPDLQPEPQPAPVVAAATCSQCGAELSPSDIFCGECGFVRQAAVRTPDTAILDPFPWGLPRSIESSPEVVFDDGGVDDASVDDADDDDDIDATRIVSRSGTGERFVLQFSTGESVSVTGTGLLGRNPIPEPGEYFDSLVVITDSGKSVSKTHLEFGQEAGAFWVSDRFSGNGTFVREPDRQPRRCDPGKRYRIVRGTRVDIGEQFFIVS